MHTIKPAISHMVPSVLLRKVVYLISLFSGHSLYRIALVFFSSQHRIGFWLTAALLFVQQQKNRLNFSIRHHFLREKQRNSCNSIGLLLLDPSTQWDVSSRIDIPPKNERKIQRGKKNLICWAEKQWTYWRTAMPNVRNWMIYRLILGHRAHISPLDKSL